MLIIRLSSTDTAKSVKHSGRPRTSRHHRLHSGAVDERPLDGLGADVRPVDPVLQSIVVHHGHVVDVRHGEGDDVIVVGVVDVHSPDFNLARVEQELTRL